MNARPILFLTLIAGHAAASGAPEPAIHQNQGPRPAWINTLPQQAGRIYALGLAAYAPTEGQALTQAAASARAEVLVRLRANVNADTRVSSQTSMSRALGGASTGRSEQQVGQNTHIQAQATELSGLVVEATWADGAERTAYALAYLDIPIAEREIRTRFSALKDDLAQEPGAPGVPRERLRKLNRLRSAQTELAKLDDLAALLTAGGGDEQLRAQVRAARLDLDRRQEQLRNSLTFSLAPSARDIAQIGTILRNAALKAGLGWSETGGEFLLALNERTDSKRIALEPQAQNGNGWWRNGWVSHSPQDTGLIVARGILEITLKDQAGTPYESTEIEAKGVGISDFQADQALKKDFKTKLDKAFTQWLDHLVNQPST